MPKDLSAIAARLTQGLELDTPPVQISYLDEPPPGVAEHPGGVPSVCTFFADGTQRPFYADLRAHEDCEIGAFVLGIPPEGDVGRRLMGTIGLMQQEGYLNPGEEAQIPHNPRAPKYVAYGPLGSLPTAPTGVLLFARPKSAMLAVEAAQLGSGATPVPMNGRPMCAIMPILNGGVPVALSLGCIGSRTYTSMGADKMVVGIRGDHLGRFVEKLERIVHANEVVGTEDRRRRNAAPRPHQPPKM